VLRLSKSRLVKKTEVLVLWSTVAQWLALRTLKFRVEPWAWRSFYIAPVHSDV